MTKSVEMQEQPDFSLVLGGPLYQLFRRAHLSGDALELLHRRVIFITCIAWVPLLLLAAIDGHVLANTSGIPFLYDVETHVRFLVALPILIAAERLVHLHIRPTVLNFVERRVVPPEDMARFRAAIESTLRLRNSVAIEVALLVLVYTVGLWVWRNQIALQTATWYAIPDGAKLPLTTAGYWYVFVSLPIFQFILLRWYLRFFLWFQFLFRVSKLNLRLVPVHPDKTAGLGFLGRSTNAFAPVLIAQGAVLAGLVASQIFFAGRSLVSFKVEIASFVSFFIIVTLIPVLVFIPNLVRAKREGLGKFGKLGIQYATQFEEKWMHDAVPGEEPLLGSADIQSLADLGNSYSIVQEMRLVPFGLKDVTRLIVVALVPFLPLMLTVLSPEELVDRLIKIFF